MKRLDLDLKPCRLSELKNNHKGQRRKPCSLMEELEITFNCIRGNVPKY